MTTLTDILAAALCPPNPWGGHEVGCRLHDIDGQPNYWDHEQQARDLIERIPAPDREGLEVGGLLAEVVARRPDGWAPYVELTGPIHDPYMTDEANERHRWSASIGQRRAWGPTPNAALRGLLALIEAPEDRS